MTWKIIDLKTKKVANVKYSIMYILEKIQGKKTIKRIDYKLLIVEIF